MSSITICGCHGSSKLENHLINTLQRAGYEVFDDTDFTVVDEIEVFLEYSENLLIFLDPETFSTSNDMKDYFYHVIRSAMEISTNIIPIARSGFTWPENLPDEIYHITKYELLDGDCDIEVVINTIKTKLTPLQHTPTSKKPFIIAACFAFLIIIEVLLFLGCYFTVTTVLQLTGYCVGFVLVGLLKYLSLRKTDASSTIPINAIVDIALIFSLILRFIIRYCI